MIKSINEFFILTYQKIQLKFYIKKANDLHKITGKQYFVVQATSKKMVVIHSSILKEWNKKKFFKRDLSYQDLCIIALYRTPQGTIFERKKFGILRPQLKIK